MLWKRVLPQSRCLARSLSSRRSGDTTSFSFMLATILCIMLQSKDEDTVDSFNYSLSDETALRSVVSPYDLISIIYGNIENLLCNFVAPCSYIIHTKFIKIGLSFTENLSLSAGKWRQVTQTTISFNHLWAIRATLRALFCRWFCSSWPFSYRPTILHNYQTHISWTFSAYCHFFQEHLQNTSCTPLQGAATWQI